MKVLFISKLISFIIQIIAAIIGVYALFQKISPKNFALQQSLAIEMFVQAIQMSMYIWLIFNLYLPSMALIRYIDWFITTPLMLISLMLYFYYEKNIYENKNSENLFSNFIKDYKQTIYIVIISNAFMLLFGIAGELKYIDKKLAISGGFISLLITISFIYNKFVSKSKNAIYLFIPFTIVWSLYGIAYMLPELQKNIFYNILDVIAKNFFGIFLAIKVLLAK
jgi:bacteriorhodopsin